MSISNNKSKLDRIENALKSDELENWLLLQWNAQPVIKTIHLLNGSFSFG